jgi:hypothetical protein
MRPEPRHYNHESSAADAGFAGVGRFGKDRRSVPGEVVMASAQPKPDFVRRWA